MQGSKSSPCRPRASTGRASRPRRADARRRPFAKYDIVGILSGAAGSARARRRWRVSMAGEKPKASPQPAEPAPHYHGHRQRLRQRFLAAGSEYEVLELILFRAIAQKDVKPLAKELIARFGSFPEAIAAPAERLKEVKGLGEAAITELKIVHAAATRLARGEVKQRPVLSSWSNVLDYCRSAMAFADKEQLRVLFLDQRNALIADEVQQTGTVDHTPVYPREVVKRALELSATAIVLVHNHPTWSEVIPPDHVQYH